MLRKLLLASAFLCITTYARTIIQEEGTDAGALQARDDAACASWARGPHQLARGNGKYFGTATAVGQWGDKPYTDILDNCETFGALTPSLGMKWDDIQIAEGYFDWRGGDAIANRALANGQILRCHTLVWPYQALPEWLTSRKWQRQELIDVLWRHVHTVVDHYKHVCSAWDVVNEALLEDGSLRPNMFFDAIGPEYITIAFQAAEQADPNVKLYYNDYNIDNDWSAAPPVPSGGGYQHQQHPNRRDARNFAHCYRRDAKHSPATNKIEGAECLIEMVREGGGKIDGIGMQGHYVYDSTPSAHRLADIMQGFADMDLDIAITELDVRMPFNAINSSSIARQTQGYEDVLTACRITDRCVGITLWDFTDKYSWVSTVLEGFGSATPWDNQMVLKEMVWGALMRGWGAEAGCRFAAPKPVAAQVAQVEAVKSAAGAVEFGMSGAQIMGTIGVVWAWLFIM